MTLKSIKRMNSIMINNFLFVTFIIISLLLFAACQGEKSKSDDLLITVNQFVEHPNLDKMYEGLQNPINAWAKENNITVTYDKKVANGDTSVAIQIAREQYIKKPAVMVALATPSAQANYKISKDSVLSASLSSAKNPIKISRILYFFNPGADDSIQRAG